ncbi:hypothetical protein BJ875DRAFT_484554 [Amylocarpus encephaloides]|uniref:Ketoreductase domain-containing protein n=1 Tax=Amylocarpus encephaloides TaxID=45428 RepID=A0A9P7YJD5_9HELO|nr:hypothetical protein BJ875DRAFT_484554 [Amylocarpus encephaloides]
MADTYAEDVIFHQPSFTKTWHTKSYAAISPSDPRLSAAGKVVLITGGGSGIGKATAKAFIEAQAAAILIVGRTEPKLKKTVAELQGIGKTTISYAVADATDAAAVDAAFATAIQDHGHIDVVVSNAGHLDDHLPIAKSDLAEYWRSFEVNIKGPLIVSRAFLKVHRPGATFINVSSAAAIMAAIPGFSSYSASKLGGAKVMEYLHFENPDLRVFNWQPATTQTDMQSKAGVKMGAPDDIGLPASFAVWLTSQESEFLRGRLVWSNFDVEEMKARADEIKEKNLLTLSLTGYPFNA